MITDGRNADREPLPRYAMPDGSEPEYEAIIEQIQYQRKSMIGSSFYYIRAGVTDEFCLCRIIPGGKKIFFHEIVDHQKYGISDEDMQEAVKYDTGTFTLPGHIHISPHIEQKLRALLDAE
ncbi:MAG: hypothetical protein WC362_01360 [Methanoregula sp.]|jgi:hypothetical protein